MTHTGVWIQRAAAVKSIDRSSVLCGQPLGSCFQFWALFAASSSGPIQIATDAPRGRGLPGILAGPRRFKRQKAHGPARFAPTMDTSSRATVRQRVADWGAKGHQAPTAIQAPHDQGSEVGGRDGLPTLRRHRHCTHPAADLGSGCLGQEELATVLADCTTGHPRGLVSTRFQALRGPGSPGVGKPALLV